ncbi:MAG: dihydroorotate dehydrogenase (quinone) [Betaproteobacteria bacterium CG2_30_68_42]|nr:MAG: dihydroorotate dehydrogenase (quinone) [Betaproteobacteria bacterium CG2_30_68_42]PIX75638.1 MAG: dihydroorotate dehydrogenase (quinone) [Rhodocyclales bacterium CG_4_10_14_3_um_filter_68_10]PJA57996.1 MAG: dihydroorotate dehydrogenase (quinone) [Rhodocyclales bacterium CG_4_9_14_3_um_filter_68_10]
MLYSLARPLLFGLDPELAHDLAIAGLRALPRLPCTFTQPSQPVRVMGLEFPNRVGCAAGLDKNGEAIDGLAALGFGFIEVGTVTPRPQPGNPRPRLFRLPQAHALINRMGFNNRGLDALIANVRRARFPREGILGINIGKNFDTPIERASEDYVACLRGVYPHAGYVAINVSSPNTRDLRRLQGPDELDALLATLGAERERLAQEHGRRVPLALKIAPDLEEAGIAPLADCARRHGVDAIIATNTTVSRTGVEHLPHAQEAGGLSGAPLFERSTEVTRRLAAALAGEVALIAAGGILTGEQAAAKLAAGAQLVQIYTGLIYRGPRLVREAIAATAETTGSKQRGQFFTL